jgi:3-deoxy-D-manno-octulosonic-acid transferase
VAGSTHPGEEEVVVEAFRRIRRSLPSARLLLAPRHPERAGEVFAMLKQSGMEAARRSTAADGWQGAVTVLDTMGELRAAYGFATVGFVGGTLVRVGGHNLLEPVAAGRAVLFGPHTENCADIADLVLSHGVGYLVRTAEEIAGTFVEIASDSALQDRISAGARSLIEEQRGASERCAEQAVLLLREGCER